MAAHATQGLAQAVQCVDEDGVIRVEVQYFTPLPRLKISPESHDNMRKMMDKAHAHVHTQLACRYCACDSQFKTDIGPLCEHHLMLTSSWHEAVRV